MSDTVRDRILAEALALIPQSGFSDATLAAAAQIKAARPNASVFTWTDSLRVYSRRSVNPAIRDVMWQSCVRNELAAYVVPDIDQFWFSDRAVRAKALDVWGI